MQTIPLVFRKSIAGGSGGFKGLCLARGFEKAGTLSPAEREKFIKCALTVTGEGRNGGGIDGSVLPYRHLRNLTKEAQIIQTLQDRSGVKARTSGTKVTNGVARPDSVQRAIP